LLTQIIHNKSVQVLSASEVRRKFDEDIQRRREAESIVRSESCAQILEEREEREAVEDDLNTIQDKLAAATIELQQKEDELDLKNREIDDLIQEHGRVVDVVEQEWR